MNRRPTLTLAKTRKKQETLQRQQEHNARIRAEKTAANIRRRDSKRSVVRVLGEQYSAVFDLDNPKPLMCGIQKAVIKNLRDLPEDFTATQIRQGIHYYCRRKEYFESYLKHTHRFDLTGSPVEPISEEHRAFAAEKLQRLERTRQS